MFLQHGLIDREHAAHWRHIFRVEFVLRGLSVEGRRILGNLIVSTENAVPGECYAGRFNRKLRPI